MKKAHIDGSTYSGCIYQVKLFFKQLFRSVIVQNFSWKIVYLVSKIHYVICTVIFYTFSLRNESSQHSVVTFVCSFFTRSITKLTFPTIPTAKKRVAAYARVSSGKDAMLHSLSAQVSYYSSLIQTHNDWEYVGVYTDEGITGSSTKHRDGFNLMVKDALDGKIDLIITKSVSRFARNTVDSLTTVRKLKDTGVEVYFEKENIYTFDSKGELLITIMSSLAQEESRSISENVTWGQRKRFADGKVTMPYKNFLGYDKGKDGKPVINEKEAEIVRLIYRLFLQGKTASGICKHLDGLGTPTPTGRKATRY